MSDLWYVAQTLSSRATAAAAHLERKGFVHYVALVSQCHFVPREGYLRPRVVMREINLFPGYIFVKFDLTEPGWKEVNRTEGVVKLLPLFLETPRPLPIGFVDELRTGIERGDFSISEAEALSLGYSRGSRVEVQSGAFAGYVGRYEGTRHGAVELLMDLLGRTTKVKVPLHQVAAAPGGVF